MSLAGTLVTLLAPYFIKGAEKFAAKAGRPASQKVESLWNRITGQFHGDKEITKELSDFRKNPGRNASILADDLHQEMKKNENFASDLTMILNDLGPSINIIQEFDEAKTIVGARIAKFQNGSLYVEQRAKIVEEALGAHIKELGVKKDQRLEKSIDD